MIQLRHDEFACSGRIAEQGVGEDVLIANARMYSVAPGAGDAWRAFFAWLSDASGVALTTIDHAYPAPLAALVEPRRSRLRVHVRLSLHQGPASSAPVGRAHSGRRTVRWPCGLCDRFRGAGRQRISDAVRTPSAADWDLRWTAPIRASTPYVTIFCNTVRPHGRDFFAKASGPCTRRVGSSMRLLARQIDVGPLDSYALDLMRRHDPALGRRSAGDRKHGVCAGAAARRGRGLSG